MSEKEKKPRKRFAVKEKKVFEKHLINRIPRKNADSNEKMLIKHDFNKPLARSINISYLFLH